MDLLIVHLGAVTETKVRIVKRVGTIGAQK